ncbi:hypothetical protein OpiT1DRAFT_03595 [Opitutaceae bacterium TAV1]|nr:hypothetical protein OpiT1DRAFT_03595 [Opitutaceae bacterium TAV1]
MSTHPRRHPALPVLLAALLFATLIPTACATSVELQFSAGQSLIFNGAGPQGIQIEVETGSALPSVTVTLELRRYDANGLLPTPRPKPASTAETTDDIRGGGGPVHLQLTIPVTGFYELTAIATDAEGKTLARKRTLLAALQQVSTKK